MSNNSQSDFARLGDGVYGSAETRKQEYLASIKQRYKTSSRKEKKKILDEFCTTCGYNRKYAIRILNKKKAEKKEE